MTGKEIIRKFEDWMIARDSNEYVLSDDIINYYLNNHLGYNYGLSSDEFVRMTYDSVKNYNEQIYDERMKIINGYYKS